MSEFVNLNAENLDCEHLCCIIRKKPHPGVDAKREWLRARLPEGHVFRKLNTGDCAFIEYAPLETAWVPMDGENFFYIYCLWVQGAPKGCGYGRRLMEDCIADAREKGKSGVCMLGSKKQKAWLSNQAFAEKFGFVPVDEAGEYVLLALSFDGTQPRFREGARKQVTDKKGLCVYYDDQCPFIFQRIEKLRAYCSEHGIPARMIHIQSLEEAKDAPCPMNNWAVFWNGEFMTVNQIDGAYVEKIIKR